MAIKIRGFVAKPVTASLLYRTEHQAPLTEGARYFDGLYNFPIRDFLLDTRHLVKVNPPRFGRHRERLVWVVISLGPATIGEIGEPQRRIELAQMIHRTLRFGHLSIRPASAWLVARMVTANRKLGKSRNAFPAHDDAVSKCARAPFRLAFYTVPGRGG